MQVLREGASSTGEELENREAIQRHQPKPGKTETRKSLASSKEMSMVEGGAVLEEEESEESGPQPEGRANGIRGDQQQLKEEDHALPLMALNHVSRLCSSLEKSQRFYEKLLGFVPIHRPPAFDFDGAWLFNYGIGIHLVQKTDEHEGKHPDASPDKLDPMDNHISFQCDDMEAMEQRLKDMEVEYLKRTVGDGEYDDEVNARIDQIFFNDPDGFMIEICNCENLKLVPAGSLGRIRLPVNRHNPPLDVKAATENGGYAVKQEAF